VRVCVVAEYYPRRRDPASGVWAHRQALAARDAGAEIARVLVLERPLPSADTVREAARGRPARLVGELSQHRRQARTETLDGIEVEYVPYVSPPRERSYSRWHRFAARPLAGALGRAGPVDLVHAHYALPSGGAARPWALRNGVPMVVSVHGGDVLAPVLSSPVARASVAEVLRGAVVVLCNSRATRRLASALAGSGEHMRVVHLGAEPPPGDPPVPHVEPTICTVGYLIARKRHSDVLEALALLPPEVRWVVVGDGPERASLASLAERLGVADRIDWKGLLPPDDALRELARCHVMAMPSEDEAFGVAYAEALACGVPAIGCAGEGGPEELAALGEGMILVPPREPESLANTIRDLLADDGELRRLGEAARRTAAEHLSWETCGPRHGGRVRGRAAIEGRGPGDRRGLPLPARALPPARRARGPRGACPGESWAGSSRRAGSRPAATRAVICGLGGRAALPASYLAARRARVPFVLWASIWAHPRTPAHALSYLPTRWLYRHADAVVTYGRHVTEHVGRAGNVFEAPQAPAPLFFEQLRDRATEPQPTGFRVLYAGRLEREKGVEVLLDAWPGRP